MKILFDTNILLDVFLQRNPFFAYSSKLLAHSEQGTIQGWICGISVTTIHYLIGKTLSTKKANQHTNNILKIFHVTSINQSTLVQALESNFEDYEDAVLYQSAAQSKLDGILTRNQKDFTASDLPVYSPKELLKIIRKMK